MTINPVSVRGNCKKNCITDPKRGDMVGMAAATLLMIGMVVLIVFVLHYWTGHRQASAYEEKCVSDSEVSLHRSDIKRDLSKTLR
jgi:hypothetical protein